MVQVSNVWPTKDSSADVIDSTIIQEDSVDVINVWPMMNPFTEEIDCFFTDEFCSSFMRYTRYEFINGHWLVSCVPFIGY